MKNVPKVIQFQSRLHKPKEGGDWAFLRLPQDASDQLSSRGMVSVDGSLNGVSFVTTLEPDSERGHWMRLEKELLDKSQAEIGSVVELQISQVLVEPEPKVPDDLLAALQSNPAAMATWKGTTAVARRDFATWMMQGKKAETRIIRLNKMMDMLSKGKKRICCYDSAGIVTKAFVCPTPADDAADH